MDLAEGGGGGGLQIEIAEATAPIGAKFRHHPPLDESGAHRRRLGLQLLQFGCVFGRHHIGDGGDELRHLHDRALQPPKRLGEGLGIAGITPLPPEDSRAGDARRHPADIDADPRIARGTGGEAVRFGIAVGHALFPADEPPM